MELRQLKYFVGIAEGGSFSEASRQFFLSQSAVSQQIKALEEELKTQLFVRNSHKVELTESGELLLPLARQVLQDANHCKERILDVNNMLCGELNIGLTQSLEYQMRQAMIRFMKIYPKVQLNVYYKTIPELIKMLRSGLLDVAFSIKIEGEEDWVESVPLVQYRLCAFMRDTHPLANCKILSFSDLEHQAIIAPEQSIKSQNAVEAYLCKQAANLHVRAVVNELGTLLNLLRHTNCISILSELSDRGDNELRVIPIQELLSPVTAYAHSLKGAHRKRSTKEFVRLLKEEIEKGK